MISGYPYFRNPPPGPLMIQLPRLKAGQPFRLLTDYSVKGGTPRQKKLADLHGVWIFHVWMVGIEESVIPQGSNYLTI